jgi:hypothetical protein
MTVDQMVSGIFGVLARRGYSTLSIRTSQVDFAMEQAFERLVLLAPQKDLDLRFCVRRDLYGDSAAIRSAITGAAQSGLVSFDGPEYQNVRLTPVASRMDLESLPGGAKLYEDLTDVFVASYENRTPAFAAYMPTPQV